jgi:hypothetical protein
MAKKQQFDAQALAKHHFWILAGLGMMALPVCWYMAKGSLVEAFTKDKSAREGVRQKVDSFQTSDQPNANINAELEKRHGRQNDEVYKAWQLQYERQLPIMDWDLYLPTAWNEQTKQFEPAAVWQDPLLWLLEEKNKQPQDAEAFRNARTKGADLPSRLRSAYAVWLLDPNNLPEEHAEEGPVQFRHLYKVIGLRRPILPKIDEAEMEKEGPFKSSPGARDFTKKSPMGKSPMGKARMDFGFPGADRGTPILFEGLVEWPLSEREYLEAKFGKSPAWQRSTSTAQVIYTHESMNVYAMLLNYVVAKTNGDQTEHQLLAIKQIKTIRLGEDCQMPTRGMATDGTSTNPSTGSTSPPMPTQGATPYPPSSSGNPRSDSGYPGGGQGATNPTTPFAVGTLGGGGSGSSSNRSGFQGTSSGGAATETAGPQPPDGTYRYVDDEGYAIADPAQQPYAEFRMLPVIMRFVMDQRRLPEVLANCVDSPLPIEVKQWNMRDPTAAERDVNAPGAGPTRGGVTTEGSKSYPGTGSKSPYPGAGSKSPYPSGSSPGVRPMGAGGAAPAGEAFGGEVELGPYDMEIEIKGIIYIYNPPDPTKVGTGVAGAGQSPPPDGKQPADPAAKVVDPAGKAVDPAGKAVDPAGKVPPVAPEVKKEPSGEPVEKAADPMDADPKGKQPPVPVPEPAKTPAAKG